MRNFALLILAFGIGQGSLFVAQTFLLATGNQSLIRDFGLAFSLFIFATILVEAGSITTLSRFASLLAQPGADSAELWKRYSEICVVRVVIATSLCCFVAAKSEFLELDAFSQGFANGAIPGLLIWAFNTTGILDGVKLGGISGLTTSIAYLSLGITLVYLSVWPGDSTGLVLGVTASASYAITVIAQFVILFARGWRVTLYMPTGRGVWSAALTGLSMLAGTLPGQVLQRVQIVLANLYLPLSLTASIIYVKQIQSALMQVVSFMRRVEFPIIVQSLKSETKHELLDSWRLQVKSLCLVAGSIGLCLIVAAVLLISARPGSFLPHVFIAAAVVMTTECLSAYCVQILYARGIHIGIGAARICAVTVGCCVSWLLMPNLALVGMVIAEVSVHLLIFIAVLRISRKHRDSGRARQDT